MDAGAADVDVRLGPVPRHPPDSPEDYWFRVVDGEVLIYSEGVATALLQEGRQVTVDPAPGVRGSLLQSFLLGPVLAFLLHQRGLLVLHASAVGSNANDGLLTIGDSADADEFLTSSSIGDSHTPAEFDGDDFVDTAGNTHARYYPRIAAGTVVKVALDHDGDGGTATNDFTLVLTLAAD